MTNHGVKLKNTFFYMWLLLIISHYIKGGSEGPILQLYALIWTAKCALLTSHVDCWLLTKWCDYNSVNMVIQLYQTPRQPLGCVFIVAHSNSIRISLNNEEERMKNGVIFFWLNPLPLCTFPHLFRQPTAFQIHVIFA